MVGGLCVFWGYDCGEFTHANQHIHRLDLLCVCVCMYVCVELLLIIKPRKCIICVMEWTPTFGCVHLCMGQMDDLTAFER